MCFLSGLVQQQKGFLRWDSYRPTEQKWPGAKQVHRDPHARCYQCSSCYITMQNHCLQDRGRGREGVGRKSLPDATWAKRVCLMPSWLRAISPHIFKWYMVFVSLPLVFLWLIACLGWWYSTLSLTRHVVLKSEILGYHKLLHSSLVRLQGT